MIEHPSSPLPARIASSLGAFALLSAASLAMAQQGFGQPVAASISGSAVMISSADDGSLRRPEDWTCDYLVNEWEDWLENERPLSEWRFADRVYRDAADGELYRWEDWLDWYDDAGCGLAFVDTTAGVSNASLTAVGAAGITAYGIAIIIDDNGRNDSPG